MLASLMNMQLISWIVNRLYESFGMYVRIKNQNSLLSSVGWVKACEEKLFTDVFTEVFFLRNFEHIPRIMYIFCVLLWFGTC